MMEQLKKLIRDVPDYPKKGIVFKDLTTLWKDPQGFKRSIDELAKRYTHIPIDVVVGAEARGFIIAAPLAYLLNAGFVPVRKPAKLPYKTIQVTYSLEYGSDTLAIHEDAIKPVDKVLIVDDLIATGGTSRAIAQLVERLGGKIVEFAFLVELSFLKGTDKIKDYPTFSLISF